MHAKSYKLTNSKNSAMTPGTPFIGQAQIFKHLLSKSREHQQLPQSHPENMDSYTRKKVKSLSHIQLFAIPWTVAYQPPLSMGFSRQEYWSGVPLPSPGDLPNPGIELGSPTL